MIVRKHTPKPDPSIETGPGAPPPLPFSDAGGLTQFGAYVQVLPPGARSSDRHYHEQEDEFLYVLSGTPTVIEEDGEHELSLLVRKAGKRKVVRLQQGFTVHKYRYDVHVANKQECRKMDLPAGKCGNCPKQIVGIANGPLV